MRTIFKVVAVVVPLVALIVLIAPSHPAQAYFYQYTQPVPAARSYALYQSYQYYAAPHYANEFNNLVQGNLNFVSNLTYIPAPVHQYFFQYGY